MPAGNTATEARGKGCRDEQVLASDFTSSTLGLHLGSGADLTIVSKTQIIERMRDVMYVTLRAL